MQPAFGGSPASDSDRCHLVCCVFGEFCTQPNKILCWLQMLRETWGHGTDPWLMVVIFSCYLPKPLFADSLRVGFYFDVLLSLKSLVLLLAPVIFGVLWREGGREKKIDVVIINVFGWIMKSHSSLKMRNHGNLDNPSYTYYIYLTMCKVHLVKRN